MKRWWQSRTIWLQIAGFLTAVGTELSVLIEFLPPEWIPAARLTAAGLVAVGTIIVRLDTSEPIK